LTRLHVLDAHLQPFRTRRHGHVRAGGLRSRGCTDPQRHQPGRRDLLGCPSPFDLGRGSIDWRFRGPWGFPLLACSGTTVRSWWRAPFMPCAPPHRSWKSAAVANRRGRPFLRFPSPSMHPWAVLFAQWFPGHHVTRCSKLALEVPPGSRLWARVSARPGFFRPLRASCSTCRACFIPAAPLGFSLQRSVRIASRTPLGSPCPSFPWPPMAPFGFPSAGRRVSDITGSRRSSDGSGQLRLLPGRAFTRPLRAMGCRFPGPKIRVSDIHDHESSFMPEFKG
jgi:hypothetical protein